MAKVARLSKHSKRIKTVKENHQLLKMEEAYKTKSASEVDLNNYKCPICGKMMQSFRAKTKNDEEIYYLICEPCKMKGKTRREKNGKILLVSVPANPKTRKLRKEAHYYFDKLWMNQAVFRTKSQAYQWLADQLFFVDMGIRHIGEFNEAFCMKTIEVSIRCLMQNESKLEKPLSSYKTKEKDSYTETSEKIQAMFEEKLKDNFMRC